MSNLFWLTDEQMERLKPFFPKSHGKPRVDDRRVLSGIIFINRNGLGSRKDVARLHLDEDAMRTRRDADCLRSLSAAVAALQ